MNEKLKRMLDDAKAKDLDGLGYEARIRHRRRIEQLELAYAGASADVATDHQTDQPATPVANSV